jgi:hypothetical protein
MVSPLLVWLCDNSFINQRPATRGACFGLNDTNYGYDTVMNAKYHAGAASMRRGHKQPRTLSAHELSTLLRLCDASAETNAVTPDLIALHEAGLVHVIASEDGDTMFALTVDGRVLLRLLGVEPAERRPYPN